MKATAGGLALLALLLSACGGQARASGEPSAASGASGLSFGGSGNASGSSSVGFGGSGSGSSEPGTSGGGGASAGTTGMEIAAAGSTNSAGSAGAPLAMHAALPCDSPTPRLHGGGYAQCQDGSLRRVSAATCDEALPRAAPDMPLAFDECTSDTDCTASPHGYCAYGACKYGCVTDDECPSDQACFCGDFVGTCISANCRSDADCPAAFPCTAYLAIGFPTPDALTCQSPEDECLTDAQCKSLNPRVTCKVQLDHRICFTDPVG